MKNVILITALAMLTCAITLKPLNIQAQSAPVQNAPAQDPKRKMAEQKFISALEAFYSSAPEASNLDALFSAAEEYLEIDKDPQASDTSSQWRSWPWPGIRHRADCDSVYGKVARSLIQYGERERA